MPACLPACLPWLHGFLLRTLLTWSSFPAEVSLLWQLHWVPWRLWDKGEGVNREWWRPSEKWGAAAILKELKVPTCGGKWVSGPSASESGAEHRQSRYSREQEHFFKTPLKTWKRQWHPTPVLLPGKSHGQRTLVGFHLWGHTELDTTEAT